ncbi:MAG: hypothetical protein M3Y91_05310, partial [Actinomycetota bacterium]|nr:hypothetical protein [Actinomycetota bacterium]
MASSLLASTTRSRSEPVGRSNSSHSSFASARLEWDLADLQVSPPEPYSFDLVSACHREPSQWSSPTSFSVSDEVAGLLANSWDVVINEPRPRSAAT